MKHLYGRSLLWAIVILMLSCAFSEANSGNYQQKIVVSDGASAIIQQSAEALAALLGKITGQPFTVSKIKLGETEDNIQLLTVEEAGQVKSIEAGVLEKLDKENPEAFVIDSKSGTPGLRIIGATDLGVRHGVYRYLAELGFRSLFPGEHWQIVPNRSNIRLDLCRAESPAFRQRQFFGTGGFSVNLPLDPSGEIEKMWESWRFANLFGTSIQLPGHYGEVFISLNKEVLEAYPEYRAMIDGKRVPMSESFQLNYGNPDLRELYIQDRLKELRTALSRRPASATEGVSVSVDPSDGGNHCTSPEALALGSVSDRVFGLANDVARRISNELPGNYVNLYAYNLHSDVPQFSLEKNVIVSVIPYGFNYSKNLIGDDLLVAWAKKASMIGLYDYWALPDWSRDQPQLDYLHTIPNKLRFWYENRVRFFNAESTTSAGTAGITLYLASKILWNPKVDDKAQLNEFYDTAFGRARAPMQRMLERWTAGFLLSSNELGLSFRDLQEAESLSSGQAEVQARVGDFISYVQYLRFLYEYDSAVRNSPEAHERADALLRYIWQIRSNAMVQTFQINQLMLNVWQATDSVLRQSWDVANPEASGWSSVPKNLSASDIASLLTKGSSDYPVLFEPRIFSSDLVPLTLASSTDGGVFETPLLLNGYKCIFQADRDGVVKMEIYFDERPDREGVVSVVDANHAELTVLRNSFPLNKTWHPMEIPVKKGQNYILRIDSREATYRLRVPSNLPLVVSGGITPVAWTAAKNWFFVPKGTKRFAIFIPDNPVRDELVVAPETGPACKPIVNSGAFTVYDVPVGDDGKIWSIEKFSSSVHVRLINVPDNLAFSPKTLMVPRETFTGQHPESNPVKNAGLPMDDGPSGAEASDLVPVVFNEKLIPSFAQMFGAPQKFAVSSPSGEPIEFSLTNNSPSASGELVLSDASGNAIQTLEVPVGENAMKLDVPKPGTYFLNFDNGENFWGIRFPEGLSVVLCLESGKPVILNGGLIKRYFYVPKGVREIQLEADTIAPKYKLDVLDSDGVVIESFDENAPPAAVPVPEGMDGTVWCLDGVSFAPNHLSFANLPNYIASSPNALLLPRDLVKKDGL